MQRPRDGVDLPLRAFADLVRSAGSYFGDPCAVDVSTVVELGDHPLHFATVARVVAVDDLSETGVKRVGDAVLLSTSSPCTDLREWEDVRQLLAKWRLTCEAQSGFQFIDEVRVRRYPGHSVWSEEPCFVFSLREDVAREWSARGARPSVQPFVSQPEGLFAESLPALASEFLGDPEMEHAEIFPETYRLVLPDRTGWFTEVERSDRSLDLKVEGLAASAGLLGATVGTGFDGRRMRESAPVTNGRVRLTFPRAVKEVEAWLVTSEGDWLDRYSERAVPLGWGGLAHTTGPVGDSGEALLREIDRGESEVLEFKPWIGLEPKDSKRYEILKVAASFGNSGGGSILFGVADDTTLLPFSKARSALGYGAMQYDEALDAYAARLLRFLREGVRPALPVDVAVHPVGGHSILRLRVEPGPDRPYSVVEDGKIFVRRGATSRTVRQDDAGSLIRPV